jgi:hypothetical protein
MDINSLSALYGKIIAIQGQIAWTDKLILIVNENITTVIPRNPPNDCIVIQRTEDIPGQQSLFG